MFLVNGFINYFENTGLRGFIQEFIAVSGYALAIHEHFHRVRSEKREEEYRERNDAALYLAKLNMDLSVNEDEVEQLKKKKTEYENRIANELPHLIEQRLLKNEAEYYKDQTISSYERYRSACGKVNDKLMDDIPDDIKKILEKETDSKRRREELKKREFASIGIILAIYVVIGKIPGLSLFKFLFFIPAYKPLVNILGLYFQINKIDKIVRNAIVVYINAYLLLFLYAAFYRGFNRSIQTETDVVYFMPINAREMILLLFLGIVFGVMSVAMRQLIVDICDAKCHILSGKLYGMRYVLFFAIIIIGLGTTVIGMECIHIRYHEVGFGGGYHFLIAGIVLMFVGISNLFYDILRSYAKGRRKH